MKKRYIASPLLLITIAITWNVVFRHDTPIATAEDIQPYLHPAVTDSRHPVDVFHVTALEGDTKNDVLAHLPTTLYPEDRVTFVVDPGFGLGTIVQVERALPVTIKDGKRVIPVRTWANTVGELLDDVNRDLGDLDKANYKTSAALARDMQIEITRVAKVKVTKKSVEPFTTQDQDDPNEWRGVTKVKQEGKDGERTKVYEVTREDGEVVAQKLLSDTITTAPTTKIVVHGKKIKVGRTLGGKATYYTSNPTALAMNQLPKGTVVRITNRNNGKQIEAKVNDTGAFGKEVAADLNISDFQKLGGTLGQGVLQNILVEEILNP